MTNSIQEIEQAEVMLVIGSNTTEAHPVISYYMKRAQKRGATLIVCDPRAIDLCRWADIHVQHRVGSDIALINGLMNEIIAQGWADEAFIEEHTEGFEAVREAVERYPVERASEITGVPADLIRRVARVLGEAESAAVYYTLGITEHICGTDNVTSLSNLQMLLGNLGKPGAGLNPLRGQNNVQGACDVGALPNVYPNYQKVGDPAVVAKFEQAWGRPGLSATVGRTMPSMLTGLEDGSVRALYVFGENIMMSEPNTAHVQAAGRSWTGPSPTPSGGSSGSGPRCGPRERPATTGGCSPSWASGWATTWGSPAPPTSGRSCASSGPATTASPGNAVSGWACNGRLPRWITRARRTSTRTGCSPGAGGASSRRSGSLPQSCPMRSTRWS